MDIKQTPKIGSVWTHHEGKQYVVIGLPNVRSSRERFPPSVVYISDNGDEYTRPLTEWHEKFTKTPESSIVPRNLEIARGVLWRRLETVSHAYFAGLPVGPARIQASDFFDNVRSAGRPLPGTDPREPFIDPEGGLYVANPK